MGRARAGQAVVLLLAVLVALAALALWVTDIRAYALRRLRARDGGDAAALAAARWQAAGLNLVGELNLIQAYMLADDRQNLEAAVALHELRQRVQLTAPVLGLLAADAVAEANGMDELEGADAFLRELADEAVFRDFYPGADEDFRAMVRIAAAKPLRAFPASPIYEDSEHPNLLVNQDFYEAILADDWCWFWFNAYPFLQRYTNHRDFGAVPDLSTEPFLGLRLGALEATLDGLLTAEGREAAMNAQLADLGHPILPPPPPDEPWSPPVEERAATVRWSVYDAGRWGAWEAMRPGNLPIEGELREEYDYFGASAAISVSRDDSTWLAAAKAFGSVAGENPTAHGLVLGGFDDVRLIPVDAADVGIRGFDVAWLRHLRFHVPDYARSGFTDGACRYCSALRTWDNPGWRARAIRWLERNGHTCRRPRPGGSSSSGGASYGH